MIGVAGPWVAGIQNERLCAQLLQADRRVELRVPGWQRCHLGIFTQDFLRDRRIVEQQATGTDIDTSAFERFQLLKGDEFRQSQFYVTVAAQPTDQVR